MTKIGGPYMFEYQAPDPAYSGISGIVVIAESHIAIHTFPELDYFTMDIFSCKNFDHELAIEYIKSAFDVSEMDRMLVQRGLSFRGPHHGKNGASDELIVAANARLQAGVISKETAVPEVDYATADLQHDRSAALARRGTHEQQGEESAAGRMLWPQYGVTPDIGTHGRDAGAAAGRSSDAGERGSDVRVIPLHASAPPSAPDGQVRRAIEALHVNPTASISGLLDKMAAMGGQGRTLGRGLALWEKFVRDVDTTIAFALPSPVLAAGLREVLAYAVEHRFVDLVVTSTANLYADLYEALGH